MRSSGNTEIEIAVEGQERPGGGFFSGFVLYRFDDDGRVTFHDDQPNQGPYQGSGGPLRRIIGFGDVIQGQSVSDVFETSSNSSDEGVSRVWFGSAASESLVHWQGDNRQVVARVGEQVPGAFGQFNRFDRVSINPSAQVAFSSFLQNAPNESGVYRWTNGTMTEIVRSEQLAPDGVSKFKDVFSRGILDNGEVFFTSTFGGSDEGLFSGNGSSIQQLLRTGDTSPDGMHVMDRFVNFSDRSLTSKGNLVYLPSYQDVAGSQADAIHRYDHNSGAGAVIAKRLDLTPDGLNMFTSFTDQNQSSILAIRHNESGQVAFNASIANSPGLSEGVGVFTGDGIDSFTVARRGDSQFGSLVRDAHISHLNELGQIAYTARLVDGSNVGAIWTPVLRWRVENDGQWSEQSNWTLGLNPAHVHDVRIDANLDVNVQGPVGTTTVRTLLLGGGAGVSTLDLQDSSILQGINGVEIVANGVLTGSGEIRGAFANQVGGTIDVRPGDQLRFTNGSFKQAGRISVDSGSLSVSARLQQSPEGSIMLRNGILNVMNGGIDTRGLIHVTGGNSSINGDINNYDAGALIIDSGANVSVLGDLVQNGQMQVDKDGSVDILGTYSGTGGFEMGGNVNVLGTLSPGNSAASVLYGGNLTLLGNSTTLIELAGLNVGQFDQMRVTGDFQLDGILDIRLIDGFTLDYNQTFDIGVVDGSLLGRFRNFSDGDLVGNFGGIDLFIDYRRGESNGNGVYLFTAVPEPSTGLLDGLMGLGLVIRRRSRSRT
ncbi:MAG: PEP-CTERM sorting domain-containing protein [Planctomycetaceae bacterium]|nr:PEP-CTERM sorting domain-containing protein [Planctomycetaceae bacterium]